MVVAPDEASSVDAAAHQAGGSAADDRDGDPIRNSGSLSVEEAVGAAVRRLQRQVGGCEKLIRLHRLLGLVPPPAPVDVVRPFPVVEEKEETPLAVSADADGADAAALDDTASASPKGQRSARVLDGRVLPSGVHSDPAGGSADGVSAGTACGVPRARAAPSTPPNSTPSIPWSLLQPHE